MVFPAVVMVDALRAHSTVKQTVSFCQCFYNRMMVLQTSLIKSKYVNLSHLLEFFIFENQKAILFCCPYVYFQSFRLYSNQKLWYHYKLKRLSSNFTYSTIQTTDLIPWISTCKFKIPHNQMQCYMNTLKLTGTRHLQNIKMLFSSI